LDKGLLRGRILDYGCGKCHEINNKHFSADGWDPYHRTISIRGKLYDTIICNYVLNVIPNQGKRLDVLEDIGDRLARGGVAYITVRNDLKRGYISGKGTHQLRIYLPYDYETYHSDYRMYRIGKGDFK
jgi:SAM-dependent methyltransferase